MNQRQLQKRATRSAILDAARRVYADRGFSATTGEIARQAGVSHGALFAHFPTLPDLIECLLGEFQAAIGARLHEMSESGGSVRALLEAHLSALQEYEGLYRRLISETSLLPDGAKNTVIAIQSVASFHFSKLMEREIERGAVKRIPVHLLFNAWIGLVHHYLQNGELFAPGGRVLERYQSELIGAFLALIHP